MPMLYIGQCDECGAIPAKDTGFMTGRVLKDGIDIGQGCWLCEDHYPRNWLEPNGARQPNNCQHIKFYWSGMPEWNAEE